MNNSCFSVDVEEWFNILDAEKIPDISQWDSLESRMEMSLDIILQLLEEAGVKATFFWLAWFAAKNPKLVRKCEEAGHEIASHGYAHLLAYKVGRSVFSEDLRKSKKILEDITGIEIKGFRAAGFGILESTRWVFEEIKAGGFRYDSSVFPALRSHGGMLNAEISPYFIPTQYGTLLEIPQSVLEIAGRRVSFFGGGYLRLTPLPIILWGINRLHKLNRPLIVYIHPREVDPSHPRLPLPLIRRFKCYVNLKSTLKKLEVICRDYSFQTMDELSTEYYKQRFDEKTY